jgi:hypothetical protein
MELQGDNQMAAPAEPRTPNMHRANDRSHKSADGSMATVATRQEKKTCPTRDKDPLDSDRPSHGRRLHSVSLNPLGVYRKAHPHARKIA